MAKTITFAMVHFTVAFSVACLISGDALIGGAIALVEPAINTIAYFFHEQVWNRRSRRRRGLPPLLAARCQAGVGGEAHLAAGGATTPN
ncbi:MAG: DUF2061 domain-containing protein [Gammaproteobacteria bacterium]|nr:DUF2061 domain-containing protein [Gammaproteobacteria bacterium]MCG3143780.1 hypothetical protein [Gammaproteobacteria bacterium]